MRIRHTESGTVMYGELLGITTDERGDVMAVLRLDGCGIYLRVVHPSKVEPAGHTDRTPPTPTTLT